MSDSEEQAIRSDVADHADDNVVVLGDDAQDATSGADDSGNAGDMEQEEDEMEDEELPLTSLQKDAVRQFVSITDTDEDMAKMVLRDVAWNLEGALNVFFGGRGPRTDQVVVSRPPTSEPVDLEGLEVSVLSWNIDGLDGCSLATRMKAVYKIVTTLSADFVFLQEVVDREIETVDRLGKIYDIHYSNRGALYYTAILTSKMFSVDKHEVIHYENSGMGRTLQIVQGRIGEQEVFLLNTHLESMKEHSRQRTAQFILCMNKMASIRAAHPHSLIFFGGDLNIRDEEVSNIPAGVRDAWIEAGCNNKTRYTWDTRTNDNKQAYGGARCRFDRLFWSGPLRRVQDFSLEGRQRIRSCLCFPSDHWAIMATFVQ